MADEFARQWSLGDHQFHLNNHPDAHYFTGESLIGHIMFCAKNDCNLKHVILSLIGNVEFRKEGKFSRVALVSILHPSTSFKENSFFLNESIVLYEGFAARDEQFYWTFKFNIPQDMPSSTEDNIEPTVKYSLKIEFSTGQFSKIVYTHPLKILTKVSNQSYLKTDMFDSAEIKWSEIIVGDTIFRCSLSKLIYDSTEKIILNYDLVGIADKLGQVMANLVRDTKICFASFTKTLATVDLRITNSNNLSDCVVVYKGDGLIIPTLNYEKPKGKLKVTNLKIMIIQGNIMLLQ
ncbi:hypothetical protein GJ496_002268 [Pomphorhynchus laevis]|nr:hypothetical protein GJ496_002268 [Pomphorhynchus laevis]